MIAVHIKGALFETAFFVFRLVLKGGLYNSFRIVTKTLKMVYWSKLLHDKIYYIQGRIQEVADRGGTVSH